MDCYVHRLCDPVTLSFGNKNKSLIILQIDACISNHYCFKGQWVQATILTIKTKYKSSKNKQEKSSCKYQTPQIFVAKSQLELQKRTTPSDYVSKFEYRALRIHFIYHLFIIIRGSWKGKLGAWKARFHMHQNNAFDQKSIKMGLRLKQDNH